ncbi:MAG: serine hydrolase domain-containing protein [Pseudomonadota bacterium]
MTASQKVQQLDTLAPLLLAKYNVPSVGVAYIENGKIAFVRHYGFQSWGFPANDETLYNIASLTKPVTAEIVMRLVEAGRISLDTPLAEHHVEEDVAQDPRIQALTPRLVMRHRTGFTNWRYLTNGVLKFSHDPDTETEYSGEGYEWMRQATAAATGGDWEELASQLVFEPSGMSLSGLTEKREWRRHLATPYKAGEAVYNVVRQTPLASDDMRSTTREYARFLINVWEGNAVSAELRAEQRTILHRTAYRPACQGDKRADFCPVNQGWGLGWFIYDYGDRKLVQHSGGDHGEAALAIYDPEASRGYVVMTNGANGGEVMHRIVGFLDGDKRLAEFLVAGFN